ncbi:MAG: regulatory protein RecX [Candidatus Zixiibacteriota bacterium]|nr:MAG: regulatory protein RecX [candidate division Zixibacteria bacterium]
MTDQVRIIKLGRSGSRVTITLSNQEKPLIVSEETVHRHRLVDGIVITRSQLEQLRHESELFRCDGETARLLALREHSVGELRTKLKRKEFAGDVIANTIKRYRRQGLLDDARYAFKLSEKLAENRPCGRSYLIAHLQKKQIDRALAEQTAEMTLARHEESEQALRALDKRWRHFSQFELEVARNKAYNYLSRRGFSYDAARKAFEKLINQSKEDSDH